MTHDDIPNRTVHTINLASKSANLFTDGAVSETWKGRRLPKTRPAPGIKQENAWSYDIMSWNAWLCRLYIIWDLQNQYTPEVSHIPWNIYHKRKFHLPSIHSQGFLFLLSFTGVSGFQGKKTPLECRENAGCPYDTKQCITSEPYVEKLQQGSCTEKNVTLKKRQEEMMWWKLWYNHLDMFGKLILWNRLGSCRTWDLFDSFFGVQQLHKLLLATVWQATVSWAMCLNSINCSKFCLHLCIPQREGILCHVDLSGIWKICEENSKGSMMQCKMIDV